VKAERQQFNVVCVEIEKERGTMASTVEEVMILQLQSEKSAVEIRSINTNTENVFRVCNAFTDLAYAKFKATNR